MQYIKQLDSIRAFAVLLVILSHWTHVLEQFAIGTIGVDMFFVLSGFLITGILLDVKKDTDGSNQKRGIAYRNFVIRRALRIFPLYYLVVLIVYLVSKYSGTQIRHDIWYYLTYTTNIRYFTQNRFDGILSHFWSLAVEEQFYIFWPVLIFFTPPKRLKLLFIGFIITGVLFRYLLYFDGLQFPFARLLTPSCFDAFGGGAFLAYLVRQNSSNFQKKGFGVLRLSAVAAFIILVFCFRSGSLGLWMLTRTLVVVITCFLIVLCIRENKKKSKSILSIPAVVWLGKISYGLYVYHMFIPWFFSTLLRRVKIPVLEYLVANMSFVLYPIALVMVAALSFHYFEKPISGLKKKFKYA